jgi:hypothetical protein
MRKDSIRNPKVRPVSTPSRVVVVGLLLAGAAGVGYCGSGTKGISASASAGDARVSAATEPPASALQVTTHPGDVRGCSFLGRVTGPSAEDGSLNAGVLRQRVVEMGGNVLLLLPVGQAEAWYCDQRARADAKVANPTPIKPLTGRFPTPAATPRT